MNSNELKLHLCSAYVNSNESIHLCILEIVVVCTMKKWIFLLLVLMIWVLFHDILYKFVQYDSNAKRFTDLSVGLLVELEWYHTEYIHILNLCWLVCWIKFFIPSFSNTINLRMTTLIVFVRPHSAAKLIHCYFGTTINICELLTKIIW